MIDSQEVWNTLWLLSEKPRARSGGQGTVRRVFSKSDNTPGALKVLHPKPEERYNPITLFRPLALCLLPFGRAPARQRQSKLF